MRKPTAFCLLLLLSSVVVQATEPQAFTPIENSISYQKEHLLYQKGDEVSVIDMDLEWPEIVDYSAVKALQGYLCQKIFQTGTGIEDFKTGYQAFLSRFGSPVTQQFKTIPDDNKFCYVDCQLKKMGYQKGRFISYLLSYKCTPGKFSTQKGDTINSLITYDLMNNKVLTMNDLVRTGRIENGYYDDRLIQSIIKGADVESFDKISGLVFLDACLSDTRVFLSMLYLTEDETVPFTTQIEAAEMRNLLTKQARNILEKEVVAKNPEFIAEDSLYQGEPIYKKVEREPSYQGGQAALVNFLKSNVEYPADAASRKVEGTVLVSFVISKDGEVGNVKVIHPVSPDIDREAVRVIKLMPKWKPAELKGQKVNMAYKMPLAFRING
jgi:TonB family protein